MKTPAEHLGEAERLLQVLEDQAAGKHMTVADTVALVNAHVTLALGINAIPLLGDAAGILREDREESTRHRVWRDTVRDLTKKELP